MRSRWSQTLTRYTQAVLGGARGAVSKRLSVLRGQVRIPLPPAVSHVRTRLAPDSVRSGGHRLNADSPSSPSRAQTAGPGRDDEEEPSHDGVPDHCRAGRIRRASRWQPYAIHSSTSARRLHRGCALMAASAAPETDAAAVTTRCRIIFRRVLRNGTVVTGILWLHRSRRGSFAVEYNGALLGERRRRSGRRAGDFQNQRSKAISFE